MRHLPAKVSLDQILELFRRPKNIEACMHSKMVEFSKK